MIAVGQNFVILFFLLLLKIGSVVPVEQQINSVSPYRATGQKFHLNFKEMFTSTQKVHERLVRLQPYNLSLEKACNCRFSSATKSDIRSLANNIA